VLLLLVLTVAVAQPAPVHPAQRFDMLVRTDFLPGSPATPVQELYPGVDGLIVRLKDEARTELGVARDRVRDLRARLGI
jgi:hypothetical protein